ncbi:MAG: hypothetical protein CL610_03455 [Anaerolineaceae bacterium]|nr:hypothetical protein [Anaerolineaceae bacterium]
MSRDDVIRKLDQLIEACQDGEDGYYVAAQGVHHTQLKAMLEWCSSQRGEFAEQLAELVAVLGGTLEIGASPANILYCRWDKIKSASRTGNMAAIVRECERGDAKAMQAYDEVLAYDLPEPVRKLIAWQYDKIKFSHQRLNRLNLPPMNEANMTVSMDY